MKFVVPSATHIPRDLKNGSYALLVDGEPDTAIMFVHGYGGDPTSTWLRFQSLMDDLQKQFAYWAQYDAYFYRYDSTNVQVLFNAKDLLAFIHGIFPKPDWAAVDAPAVPYDWRPTPQYKHLILAAHSEGAVIVRRAVLEQIRLHRDRYWFDQTAWSQALKQDPVLAANLRLFAPAAFGAQLSGWKGFLLNFPGLRSLTLPLLQRSAAYQNIKDGSTILKEIQQETKELLEQHRDVRALRARTLFGRHEDVVAAEVFFYDESSEVEDSADHISVCKPTPTYTRPLEFVVHATAGKAAP